MGTRNHRKAGKRRGQTAKAPSRTASLARAAYRAIIYGELAVVLIDVMHRLTIWRARVVDQNWLLLWVFTGLAIGATIMIACGDPGRRTSRWPAVGKGIVIGVLAAPIGIGLVWRNPWFDLSIIPAPIRTADGGR